MPFLTIFQHPFFFISFLAVLLCNFQNDFCGWQNVEDSPDHKWERKTVEELSGENRIGPDTTFNGNLDNRFVIAGNIGDSTDEAFASLKSPNFESFEHPQECFSFWFYFGVKIILNRFFPNITMHNFKHFF